MSVRNKELLQQTLRAVEVAEKVGRWDQGRWFESEDDRVYKGAAPKCGSAMCFFGWGAQLSPDVQWDERSGSLLDIDGNEIDILEWGNDAFGLTYDEGDALADAGNSLQYLRDLVCKLINDEDIIDY